MLGRERKYQVLGPLGLGADVGQLFQAAAVDRQRDLGRGSDLGQSLNSRSVGLIDQGLLVPHHASTAAFIDSGLLPKTPLAPVAVMYRGFGFLYLVPGS